MTVASCRGYFIHRLVLPALLALLPALPVQAQDRVTQFKQLASQIVERRLAGMEENQADQTRAVGLVDALVLEQLNGAVSPDPEAITKSLEPLVLRQPPVGEEYRLLRMGPANSPWFLLSANFGLAGPSALRIYAKPADATLPFRVAAQIDRFTQAEYFDEFMAVVQISPGDGVFVTVTGRTDELETGSFMAWRFDGLQLQRLWSTELLERSRYELSGMEFRLTYCEESDEDDPRKCVRMKRESYTWRGEWRMLERREVKP
jgi:hypothetical protein